MKTFRIAIVIGALLSVSQTACVPTAESHGEANAPAHEESEQEHKLVVTTPVRQNVVRTQQYVCQIHSCQHIEVRSLEGGYLEEIRVKEGQMVNKGELMFKINPTLFQAKLATEMAEAQRIKIEFDNAKRLSDQDIVSPQQLAIKQAELAKAEAQVRLARAEINFTEIRAPFTGIVDRQRNQLGSLIEEGDVLTTFSDNSTMWAYFNVPEARYLEYKQEIDNASQNSTTADLKIELKLANGQIFDQSGKIGAIEADFNNTTGNIAFRADFPNPDGLLRNGQTGTILIHRTQNNAIVIPQRATFEILAKRYAYVVDEQHVVHQRDITIAGEQEDIFVVSEGLTEHDHILLEGIRQVHDGDTIQYESINPSDVLNHLKFHAE